MRKTTKIAAKQPNVLPFKTEDFKDRTQIYNPRIGKWVKRKLKSEAARKRKNKRSRRY